MRVEVLERLDRDRVRFRAAGGEAVATWSESPAPAAGEFQVEADIPGDVGWGDILLDPPAGPALETSGGTTTVTGVLEGMDEAGVLTVRLPDGYLLVDTEGDPPLDIVGRTIRLTVPELRLYPFTV